MFPFNKKAALGMGLSAVALLGVAFSPGRALADTKRTVVTYGQATDSAAQPRFYYYPKPRMITTTTYQKPASVYYVSAPTAYVLHGYTSKDEPGDNKYAHMSLNDKRLEDRILKDINKSDFAPPGSSGTNPSVY